MQSFVFFSNEDPRSPLAQKYVDSLLSPVGMGTRCVRDHPLQYELYFFFFFFVHLKVVNFSENRRKKECIIFKIDHDVNVTAL